MSFKTSDARQLRQECDALRNEFQACRRKLDSKCEALLILSKDLDQCRQQRDQFKLMAEQVQLRYQSLKRQLAGVESRTTELDAIGYSQMKQQNLAQLLYEMREANKCLQFEVDDLKQKLSDALGDIKLLREQIARQRVGTTDEGLSPRHFPAHEREDLVRQLEEAEAQRAQSARDLAQVLDEKVEHETERDVYKNKYERLNAELNRLLRGDEQRIVDIDAVVMDNRYLQERMKQMEEEKSIALATVSKYKGILERKKNRGILKLGQSRSGGVLISQKQVQQLLETRCCLAPSTQMLADLQSLASALLDTVNDKNVALSHQRKTNKILGGRISELEKKLHALEQSGLWSVTERSVSLLSKLRQDCDEMRILLPHPDSGASGESEGPSDTPTTPLTPTGQDGSEQSANVSLADLDLLPTKEVILGELATGELALQEMPQTSVLPQEVITLAENDGVSQHEEHVKVLSRHRQQRSSALEGSSPARTLVEDKSSHLRFTAPVDASSTLVDLTPQDSSPKHCAAVVTARIPNNEPIAATATADNLIFSSPDKESSADYSRSSRQDKHLSPVTLRSSPQINDCSTGTLATSPNVKPNSSRSMTLSHGMRTSAAAPIATGGTAPSPIEKDIELLIDVTCSQSNMTPAEASQESALLVDVCESVAVCTDLLVPLGGSQVESAAGESVQICADLIPLNAIQIESAAGDTAPKSCLDSNAVVCSTKVPPSQTMLTQAQSAPLVMSKTCQDNVVSSGDC